MPRQAVIIDATGLGFLFGFTHQSKDSVGIWMLAWPSAKQWLGCDGSRVARLSLSVAAPYTLIRCNDTYLCAALFFIRIVHICEFTEFSHKNYGKYKLCSELEQ